MRRRVILYSITIIISLALRDDTFDTRNLIGVSQILQIKNLGPVKCTPFR